MHILKYISLIGIFSITTNAAIANDLELQKTTIPVLCGESKEIFSNLSKNKFHPIVISGNNDMQITFFIDEETKGMVVLTRRIKGMSISCIAAVGEKTEIIEESKSEPSDRKI